MTQPAQRPPAPPADLDEAFRRIRDHGGRVTPAKRALVELLYGDAPPLTTDEILAQLDGHDRSVVYRNLSRLEELGIAEHLHLGHGQAVYRLAGLPTVPVVCSRCGTTHHLDRTQTQAFARRVETLTGVVLDLTHFPLTGTCRHCTETTPG